MKKNAFPTQRLSQIETPFYYYDMDILDATLSEIKKQAAENFQVHYAIKANANKRLLEKIASQGFGADCVSGNEVKMAIASGFDASKVFFAGVGKTDKEINLGLDLNIACFNVESFEELVVIEELARAKNKVASVSIRINPNVDAHTHAYITTGKSENKFGFEITQIPSFINLVKKSEHLSFYGVHYHIGSQITDLSVYGDLCKKLSHIHKVFEDENIELKHINVGGGLGIDYTDPQNNPYPDFKSYFDIFKSYFKSTNATIHFELGRSVVAQCGSLITKVVYVKKGISKQFVIVDAGMSDLIRPALYQAYHKIVNISSTSTSNQEYEIVGPICESSDVFAKGYLLPITERGDLLAILSAGAYGEVMASQYNLRELPKSYYSDKL